MKRLLTSCLQTTSTRLDNARTEFVLRSVLIKWRDKSAAAVVETKRAAVMDRIRLLSTALSRWRLRAWTLRRKRWADEMRGRMVEMQNSVSKRQLGDFFSVSIEWLVTPKLVLTVVTRDGRGHTACPLH